MPNSSRPPAADSRRGFLQGVGGLSVSSIVGTQSWVRSALADTPTPSSGSWSKLESRIHGTLLKPADPRYETARHVWNGAIDRRPAAILVCAQSSDVVAGVNFAAAQGLKASVRGGGHNVAGRAIQTDALLIDLSAMRDVQVNAHARQAEAAGGATFAELDKATGAVGLATVGGMVSTTGVGGLTLGGGIGWLMRRYGLTIDNLRSAQVILADGREVTASAHENADLFWALRGGGGHLGVVTRFVYALHPVSEVLAGSLWYRADRALEVLKAFRELCATAPDELTMVAAALVAPQAPFIPPPMRGQPVINLSICWCGDPETGQKAIAPLRSAVTADLDQVTRMAYPAWQVSHDVTAPPGLQNYWSSRYLAQLDEAALAWFAAHATTLPTPASMIHCHQLGGAVSRNHAHDAAADLRQHSYLINVIGVTPDLRELQHVTGWAHSCVAGFGSKSAHAYVNFSGAAGAFSRASFADETQQRLKAIKSKYDPTGLFL
jgi:FAD/FMN-containing dehydrogenase